jgi:tight adherence protein B
MAAMDALSVLAALGASLATLLVMAAIGRPLLARRHMAERTQRFLDVAPSPTAAADPDAAPDPSTDALARARALAIAHRGTLLLALAALALLAAGSLILNRVVGVLLAGAVAAGAVWQTVRRDARRRAVLEAQFVPALRLMGSALESGYSVHQALERVARDAPRPIADEFAQVVRAVELGTPLATALGALADRGEDFEFFATIVAVQYRVGGDLPSLLRGLADTVQERLQIRAEVRAFTAQARYSGWVLTALPFVVLGWMFLVSPGYANPLLTTTLGRIMLVFAGLLLFAGLVSIRGISEVEV